MKQSLILIPFILFFAFNTQGQDFYSVIAEHGLVVRNKPELRSERVGKLYEGEPVELIEDTKIRLEITDNDKTIEGNWFLVESKSRTTSKLEGYVFSGYLMKNNDYWNVGWGCEQSKIVCSAEFSTKFSDYKIYNFQITDYLRTNIKSDTLVLYEEVFNEIGDKLLKVKPRGNYKNIEIHYTRIETLNDWGETKNSDGIIPKWKGSKPYVKLEPVNEFYFRIPKTDYEIIREFTAKELNLVRSPDWDLVGEGWWYPRYQYKGLIVPYEIKSILFKIIITDLNNRITTEYVEIKLSYGC